MSMSMTIGSRQSSGTGRRVLAFAAADAATVHPARMPLRPK